MMSFVITRHSATYMHSTMVKKAALLILSSVFSHCPELLIGIKKTKTVEEVLERREEIYHFAKKAAFFHDIGKNSLVDIITTEHRQISDDEFHMIKLHPEQGWKYLSLDPAFKPFRDIAIGHHKFYNGQGGYPEKFNNLTSPDKPIIDLITICDCLDAATDYLSRNYQRVKTLDQVIAEFKAGAGTRYHPGFVRLLETDPGLYSELEHLITEERRKIYYRIYKKSLQIQ